VPHNQCRHLPKFVFAPSTNTAGSTKTVTKNCPPRQATACTTSIDWSTYKQIIRRPRTTNPTTLVKHVHGMAPTGKIAHHNNHHYSDKCPACACPVDTNDHLIQCQADSRREWRRTSRAGFIIYVNQTLSSDPQLGDILRDGLARWELDLPPISIHDYPPAYHPLIESQNTIGWSHLYHATWNGLSQKHSDGPAWVRKVGTKLSKHKNARPNDSLSSTTKLKNSTITPPQ
jgi:hypothetical protein